MNLKLRPIEDPLELERLMPLLERGARESSASYLPDGLSEGSLRRALERSAGRPEALVLVAEAEGEACSVMVTAPFDDPLTGESVPLVTVLYVDPGLRNRGVARALVEEARRILRARGVAGLAARAATNDDAIISMGERWGLVRTWEYMTAE